MTMKTRATILALPLQLLFVMACGEKGPATGAAGPADPGTQPQVTAPAQSAELREKLRTLAVAAECLRRSDAPNEVVSRAMMDLYAEHGIDLDTYAREMGRLGGDASFQAEIQAGLSSCPTPPVAVGDPAAADPATEADAGATGADPGSVIAAAAPDAEGAGGVGVERPHDPAEGGPARSSPEPRGAREAARPTPRRRTPRTHPTSVGPGPARSEGPRRARCGWSFRGRASAPQRSTSAGARCGSRAPSRRPGSWPSADASRPASSSGCVGR